MNLPLFPLNVVLCPSEPLALHIFEERYRDMVRYCMETEEPFGIVLLAEEKLAEIGCTARIDRVIRRYEDGRLDILVVGERRFRVQQLYRERAYLTAEVEAVLDPLEQVETELRERAITQHMKLLELSGAPLRPSLYEGVRLVSYVLAREAGLDLQQKQQLLELASENERIAFLVAHFEALLPRMKEIREARRKIKSNGHFKEGPPSL